jgi:uncharacterized membrane protein YhaH (DUF805 family)
VQRNLEGEGMTFVDAIKDGFKNYATFRGTASRSAYWYFFLFSFLVTIVSSVLDGVLSSTSGSSASNLGSISSLVAIGLVLPRLSLEVRRFRDAGFSPWLLLLSLVPLAAFVAWIAAVGVSAFSASAGLQGDPNSLSDNQLQSLVAAFMTPASLTTFIVLIITSLGVGIFSLVVTLLPSKSIEQGNRILAKEVARQQPIA